MNWLLRFLINALVFYCIAKFVPGFYHDVNVWNAIIAAIVFGLVNMVIGPILRLISLPLTWITHGLFAFVINYLLFVDHRAAHPLLRSIERRQSLARRSCTARSS